MIMQHDPKICSSPSGLWDPFPSRLHYLQVCPSPFFDFESALATKITQFLESGGLNVERRSRSARDVPPLVENAMVMNLQKAPNLQQFGNHHLDPWRPAPARTKGSKV